MIIGNNTNFNNNDNNFNNKFRAIKENNNNLNTFSNNEQNKYTNINSGNEILDKSFKILQDRLDHGLITLDEFNKKCNQLNKQRQK